MKRFKKHKSKDKLVLNVGIKECSTCDMNLRCEECVYQKENENIKSEIERLEKARQRQAYLSCNLRGQKYELMNRISVVKNEAYKEFAEIIKDKWFDNRYDSPDVGFDDFIDNVLKEMVGEEE